MREAGLFVPLNTDDPAMMDLDLGDEYRSVAAAMDMEPADMAAIALEAIEATWLDDGEKRALRSRFENEIVALDLPQRAS